MFFAKKSVNNAPYFATTDKVHFAFIDKSGETYHVRKGNSGEILKSFSGENAKEEAEKYLQMLHSKNDPKDSNRGKAAEKRELEDGKDISGPKE